MIILIHQYMVDMQWYANDVPTITELFNTADQTLFKQIVNNTINYTYSSRCYQKRRVKYNLCSRTHGRKLTRKYVAYE